MKKLLLLLPLDPMFAADPAGFKMWKAQELTSIKASATKLAGFWQCTTGFRRFAIRTAKPNCTRTDRRLIVVESGEATLAIGGTQVNPKTTGPGEYVPICLGHRRPKDARCTRRHSEHPRGRVPSVPVGTWQDGGVFRD